MVNLAIGSIIYYHKSKYLSILKVWSSTFQASCEKKKRKELLLNLSKKEFERKRTSLCYMVHLFRPIRLFDGSKKKKKW